MKSKHFDYSDFSPRRKKRKTKVSKYEKEMFLNDIGYDQYFNEAKLFRKGI